MPKIPFSKEPHSDKSVSLDENSMDRDPYRQFSAWFRNAVESGVPEPEAMFLATADKDGMPSGRVVLLKGVDPNGFVFFTNYNSRKGREIASNPFVAIAFHWKSIDRQVRVTGRAQMISGAESDEYFTSRPLDSRISAIISLQSSIIPNRDYLEKKFEDKKNEMKGMDPIRPSNWGGFRVIPSTFEFWQSRPHRLHDRIHYRIVDGNWILERLSP
jgi:pyridoxamine 5'-phosphate oxidase